MSATHLYALAKRYPDVPAALAELANLSAVLSLPAPTVHVVSDVHGEYVKLRQVINNASGSLRPRFDRLFADVLSADEIGQLLSLIYYPRETWLHQTAGKDAAEKRALLLAFVPRAVAAIRDLARQYTLKHVDKIIPDPFDGMLHELLFEDVLGREEAFVERIVEPFLRHDRDVDLVRMLGRIVRNLSVGELIVAGDLGDRGPRLDKVIDLLMQQPNVAVTWGNHDTVWMAACLGHPAAIATVIRLSLRYRRLSQLEEGYGVAMAPLEKLAREAYGDDPCERFRVKGEGLRDDLEMARMQKAAAILQFKLEGQLFRRRTDWGMGDRALLHRIDPAAGTIDLGDGVAVPLTDTRLPTVDWADPYALTAGEQACLDRLTRAFLESGTLWKHMTFVASRGRMSLRRDRCAIFHGCVPVDERGDLLPMTVDGRALRGKPLFDAIEVVVQRAFRKREMADVDLLFYLWTGPLSPCFGKDKMATFETYFVADKELHKETKNPYFKLIHEPAFCARILREFGADEQLGFIVNGHVPVKLEKGETPIKKSGRAITIDGAFAAAYGDKGFSLVLDAHRIYLAQHHHFASVDAAVEEGADIVPTVSDVQVHDRPRTVGDTEKGAAIRDEIAALEELVRAYETNVIRESP
ncbi:MAG: fructose-bisphosphatase class III [Deltaproteobacteria bacterium]|nr:fructose-bisphosphatase class III [Deltaproteobacteria bacterium]